jgi:hypothetical protein
MAGFFALLFAFLKTKTDLLRKPLNFGALKKSLVQALKDTPDLGRFSDFALFESLLYRDIRAMV